MADSNWPGSSSSNHRYNNNYMAGQAAGRAQEFSMDYNYRRQPGGDAGAERLQQTYRRNLAARARITHKLKRLTGRCSSELLLNSQDSCSMSKLLPLPMMLPAPPGIVSSAMTLPTAPPSAPSPAPRQRTRAQRRGGQSRTTAAKQPKQLELLVVGRQMSVCAMRWNNSDCAQQQQGQQQQHQQQQRQQLEQEQLFPMYYKTPYPYPPMLQTCHGWQMAGVCQRPSQLVIDSRFMAELLDELLLREQP